MNKIWRRWKGKFNCYEYRDEQEIALGAAQPRVEDGWEEFELASRPAAAAPTAEQILALERRSPMSDGEALRFGRAVLLLAERAAATAPAGGVTELPDDIRVPLDSLHADALYLTSRVAQGTMSAVRLSQVIRERIDAAKAALAGAAQGAEPDAWRFQWRNGDVGFMDAGETADRLRKGVVGEDGTVTLNPDSGRTNWKPLVYAASPQPPTGTSKEGAADHGR